jgi:hypothetical protein
MNENPKYAKRSGETDVIHRVSDERYLFPLLCSPAPLFLPAYLFPSFKRPPVESSFRMRCRHLKYATFIIEGLRGSKQGGHE